MEYSWQPVVEHDSYAKCVVPYPESLFRYRSITPESLDRIIDFEINQEGIYLAALDQLNDPDDGKFVIRFPPNERSVRNYWMRVLVGHARTPSRKLRQEEAIRRARIICRTQGGRVDLETQAFLRHIYGNVVRVACFTTNPINNSMWANYGTLAQGASRVGHAGICIEYDCDAEWANLQLMNVTYADQTIFVDPTKRTDEDLVRAVYTKTREWIGEEEWRVSFIVDAKPPFADNFDANARVRVQGAVRAIIFGESTPQDIIDDMRKQITLPNLAFKKVVSNLQTKRSITLLD